MKRLEHYRPNGWDIALYDHGDGWYTVEYGNYYDEFEEPYVDDFQDLVQAKEFVDQLLKEFGDKPNWEAQAAYDMAHGTINGEDEMIVLQREMAN